MVPVIVKRSMVGTTGSEIKLSNKFDLHLSPNDLLYKALGKSMPSLDFRRLEDSFVSWFKELGNDVTQLPTLSSPTTNHGVVYEVDHHLFMSDYYVSHYTHNNIRNTELCIKLANNGFLYSRPMKADEINACARAPLRYCSTSCVTLDKSHLSQLGQLVGFAEQYLRTLKVSVKLHYDFNNNRVVFKAYESETHSRGVILTYEDLPVMDDTFDDNYWLDVGGEGGSATDTNLFNA